MPTVWPYWVGQTYPPTGSTSAVWNVWVTTNQTTGSVYPQPAAWQGWVNQPITGVVGYNQTVWVTWQTVGTANILPSGFAPAAPAAPVQLTPEQRAEQHRRQLVARNRSRAHVLRRKLAARKAEQLLLEHLSASQREEWQTDRAFTVLTADGKRAYRIAYGLAGNVRLVKADEPPLSRRGNPLPVGARFCMHVYHPDGQVPNEDNVLAQKLLIESNEAHFLELANVS